MIGAGDVLIPSSTPVCPGVATGNSGMGNAYRYKYDGYKYDGNKYVGHTL